MRAARFLVTVLAALAWACGGEGGSGTDDGTGKEVPGTTDVLGDGVPGDLPGEGGAGDEGPADATGDVPADVSEDVPEDVPGDVPADVPADVPVKMVSKHFTFRAIGGVSMGANAITVAVHRPGYFDAVGAMGGYIDYRYVTHLFRDMLGGGFCPYEQLTSPEVLADIDNPNNPKVWCGPRKGTQPWEFDWDYNHFHFDDSGGDWARDFYLERLQNLTQAFGNFFLYNPDHDYLPQGLPSDWLTRSDADRCANPARVGKPYNYSKEFNPEGKYDLITFCDGKAVGCKDGDPAKCDSKNPDYRDLAGWYDPSLPHTYPVPYTLAVDYNGNGRRDYGEPIIINTNERFLDAGVDGCANGFEDGKGGCLQSPVAANADKDPNGDDFDLLDNPLGTEGNSEYDDGERFFDDGLDGVPGTGDFGEGSGSFDYNPHLKKMIDNDAHTFFDKATVGDLRKTQYYFDGGIRDALHALTAATHTANALAARGEDVKAYENFGGHPTSLFPDVTADKLVEGVGDLMLGFDWSVGHLGRNVVVRYGDPDATLSQILGGNGKHVGSGAELALRPITFFSLAMSRMPDPIRLEAGGVGTTNFSSYYSDVLKSRRWFGYELPPTYDDPENANVKYPLGVMLPGVGMPLKETTSALALLSITWSTGATPLFVLLAPDGQCCFRQVSTGERICNCYRYGGGMYQCVEAQCKGKHEECAQFQIPSSDLEQECPSGHFFVNQTVDKWGDNRLQDVRRFEDSLFEVVDLAPTFFRIKEPADVLVPEGEL